MFALRGQKHAPVAALEQVHAQRLLQHADLPADRPVREPQFVTGLHKAAEPCGGLEKTQRIQRRLSAHHLSVFLTCYRKYKSLFSWHEYIDN